MLNLKSCSETENLDENIFRYYSKSMRNPEKNLFSYKF